MDGFGIGDLGRTDDRRDVQVTVARCRRSNADRLVGELDVLRLGIGFGVHDHRFHAEFTAGPLDAQCDLASVGDQDLVEHQLTRL
jgi:hypothetical protein